MEENHDHLNLLSHYPDVLNIEQLCEILGIGKKLAYRILKAKKIENLKIGRSYRIPKISLIKYILNQPDNTVEKSHED